MDLETKAKPKFLNHEDPRVWFLTDLEHGSPFYFYILKHVQRNCGINVT